MLCSHLILALNAKFYRFRCYEILIPESLGIFVNVADSHLPVSPTPEIGFLIGAMDLLFFFNLTVGKIALQCCFAFCLTTMQISHSYT